MSLNQSELPGVELYKKHIAEKDAMYQEKIQNAKNAIKTYGEYVMVIMRRACCNFKDNLKRENEELPWKIAEKKAKVKKFFIIFSSINLAVLIGLIWVMSLFLASAILWVIVAGIIVEATAFFFCYRSFLKEVSYLESRIENLNERIEEYQRVIQGGDDELENFRKEHSHVALAAEKSLAADKQKLYEIIDEYSTFEKYVKSPFTEEISLMVAENIVSMINDRFRRNTIGIIKGEIYFGVYENGIGGLLYSFETHRLENISNPSHRALLAETIANFSLTMVSNELVKEKREFQESPREVSIVGNEFVFSPKAYYVRENDCGDYFVNYKDPSGGDGIITYKREDSNVTIKYFAENGNYVKLKSWDGKNLH